MTTFQLNEAVCATVNAQGLKKGEVYLISGVIENPTPFGNFVTYAVRHIEGYDEHNEPVLGKPLHIVNGHLLLERLP